MYLWILSIYQLLVFFCSITTIVVTLLYVSLNSNTMYYIAISWQQIQYCLLPLFTFFLFTPS